jgi:hypothetical protein
MANEKHGLTVLKRLMGDEVDQGMPVIDARTKLGRELLAWRAQLEADLGGASELSTQQQALLDIVMRTKLLLDTVDHWLLRQPSLVDKRKRQLYPAVVQRTQLADSLARHLGTLGLARHAKSANLADYLAANRGSEAGTKGPP